MHTWIVAYTLQHLSNIYKWLLPCIILRSPESFRDATNDANNYHSEEVLSNPLCAKTSMIYFSPSASSAN